MLLTSSTRKLIPLLLVTLSGFAQAAYITDQIKVEVYAQPFGQGAKLATLTSGASVKVLSSDGEYARVLTADNLTGWIEASYLTDLQPAQDTLQALQKKNRDQAAELIATKEKIDSLQKSRIKPAELKKLRKDAKDAGWMRAELKKARAKVKQLEASAKATSSESSTNQQELSELRIQNAGLEQRLAATLLINEHQQSAEMTSAPETDTTGPMSPTTYMDEASGTQNRPIKLEWFIGSILTAIVIGIILGMVWMDKRMRRSHGGFRLY